MAFESRWVERLEWSPIHGARTRKDDEGRLVLQDGSDADHHLLRWVDARVDGARVKLDIVVATSPTSVASDPHGRYPDLDHDEDAGTHQNRRTHKILLGISRHGKPARIRRDQGRRRSGAQAWGRYPWQDI